MSLVVVGYKDGKPQYQDLGPARARPTKYGGVAAGYFLGTIVDGRRGKPKRKVAKAAIAALTLALTVAAPVSAAKPFIDINQELQVFSDGRAYNIIWGEWVTVTYAGSDYARFSCSQNGVVVWEEFVYLPGEGGPRQVTPVLPYHAASYSQCSVRLVASLPHRERTLATDTFIVYSPV